VKVRDVTETSSITRLALTSYVYGGHFVFSIWQAYNDVVFSRSYRLDKARRAKRRTSNFCKHVKIYPPVAKCHYKVYVYKTTQLGAGLFYRLGFNTTFR
jgi:hypothetical protein